VLCVGRRVVGYYSLAAGSLLPGTARRRRNVPKPVPIVRLRPRSLAFYFRAYSWQQRCNERSMKVKRHWQWVEMSAVL
jgi:hypothetical protein